MSEVAEEQAPVSTKPSWFRRIADRFSSRPEPETESPDVPVAETPPVPQPTVMSTEKPQTLKPDIRALRKVEYERRKTAEGQIQVSGKVKTKGLAETPSSPTNAPVVEMNSSSLPPGIKERIRFYQGLLINRAEIPWLEQAEVRVPLELITLNTSQQEQFLYGSIIDGKRLNRALEQLKPDELKFVDNALFIQLAELIQTGSAPDVKKVRNHVTEKPIFETGNQHGQRVYFMRLDRIQDLPVILRVAAGNKAMFATIFNVIAGESHRAAKMGGKL
ncbi:MAG: hypothetical protein Q7R49_01630 [Candidatus Daviesbacteria bacterium]|nr:hypothetical protein [Candidatus Daviesbacteria bacterium]